MNAAIVSAVLRDAELVRDAIALGELRDASGNTIAPGLGAELNAEDIEEMVLAYTSVLANPDAPDADYSPLELACRSSIRRSRCAE